MEVPVLEADPEVEVIVEFPVAVTDAEEEEPVEVTDPDVELETDGPPVMVNRTL